MPTVRRRSGENLWERQILQARFLGNICYVCDSSISNKARSNRRRIPHSHSRQRTSDISERPISLRYICLYFLSNVKNFSITIKMQNQESRSRAFVLRISIRMIIARLSKLLSYKVALHVSELRARTRSEPLRGPTPVGPHSPSALADTRRIRDQRARGCPASVRFR